MNGKLILRGLALALVIISNAMGEPPVPSKRVGQQVNEWLGIVGHAEPPVTKIKTLLLTPAELTANERQQIVDQLVGLLNTGIDPEKMFNLFDGSLHIVKKYADRTLPDPESLIGPSHQFINRLVAEAIRSEAKDPKRSYEYARAALLLSCYKEVTDLRRNLQLGRDGGDPKMSKILKFDQANAIPQAMRDAFHRWAEQIDQYNDKEFSLVESQLDPISKRPGAPISKEQAEAILARFKELEPLVGDLASNKWWFAQPAADALRLVRARQNTELDQTLSHFLRDIAAKTDDPVYRRWLNEALAVEPAETGALIGEPRKMLIKPDGSIVPATQDATGHIVEKKE